MPQNIKLWGIINNNELNRIPEADLDLEEKLEDWIEEDPSIISEDLLIIGRQVTTDLGGAIDLLAITPRGDLTIIELKRNKTPREVSAQILEYGAWAKDLSYEDIEDIANDYLEKHGFDQSFDNYFQNKFDQNLPDTLNEEHKMLVVASDLSDNAERVIDYLSENYGVNINAATLQYFKEGEKEFLGRTFLVSGHKIKRRTGSKRNPDLTLEELEEIAEKKNFKDVYKGLVKTLRQQIEYDRTTRSGIAFVGTNDNDRRVTLMTLIPANSKEEEGLLYKIYLDRFADYFNIDKEELMNLLPNYWTRKEHEKEWIGEEGRGYFQSTDQVKTLRSKLKDS